MNPLDTVDRGAEGVPVVVGGRPRPRGGRVLLQVRDGGRDRDGKRRVGGRGEPVAPAVVAQLAAVDTKLLVSGLDLGARRCLPDAGITRDRMSKRLGPFILDLFWKKSL